MISRRSGTLFLISAKGPDEQVKSLVLTDHPKKQQVPQRRIQSEPACSLIAVHRFPKLVIYGCGMKSLCLESVKIFRSSSSDADRTIYASQADSRYLLRDFHPACFSCGITLWAITITGQAGFLFSLRTMISQAQGNERHPVMDDHQIRGFSPDSPDSLHPAKRVDRIYQGTDGNTRRGTPFFILCFSGKKKSGILQRE